MLSTSDPSVDDFAKLSIYEVLFQPKDGRSEDTAILVDASQPCRFYNMATLRERILKLGGLLQQRYQWQVGDMLAICAENDASIRKLL